jgi:deoxycytidylate deaminase
MDCGIPCSPCLVEIINAGIEEIIVTKLEYYDLSAEYLLKESGLKYRIYEHLK